MQKAEEGDLTVRGTYAGQDEAGQLTRSFNVMMDQFNEVVSLSSMQRTAYPQPLSRSRRRRRSWQAAVLNKQKVHSG